MGQACNLSILGSQDEATPPPLLDKKYKKDWGGVALVVVTLSGRPGFSPLCMGVGEAGVGWREEGRQRKIWGRDNKRRKEVVLVSFMSA